VGDFDSESLEIDQEVSVKRLKAEKDETDLQECIDLALELGCGDITITCASGGRVDHYLANLFLLEYIYKRGVRGRLINAQNQVFFHPGGRFVMKTNDFFKYISIVPLDEEITGVTLKGLKYPLNNATIKRYKMVSISNEPIDDAFEIAVANGRSLVILSKDSQS
jgi:thiamine pyrophosphokinase